MVDHHSDSHRKMIIHELSITCNIIIYETVKV